MMIDSRLRGIRDGESAIDPEQQAAIDEFIASMGPREANDVLDGTCSLILMFMTWLRNAYEDHDRDVIEYVVPSLVATMRMMTRSVRPEAIPTMTGLVVAAGTDLSPSLWRKQYGVDRAGGDSLEVTAFLLAEHINRITDDPDFAIRMVTKALSEPDED
ncbi:hypothetical protein NKH77_16730 [Streptomyces sp. M19]